MIKLYPVRIITVMDEEDPLRVCAFPISDAVKFTDGEKALLREAYRQLVSCRHIFICDAIRAYGKSPETESAVTKIKKLLIDGALAIGLTLAEAERNIKTLGCLTTMYWAEETTLLNMGFLKADVHVARIAWLGHLLQHY